MTHEDNVKKFLNIELTFGLSNVRRGNIRIWILDRWEIGEKKSKCKKKTMGPHTNRKPCAKIESGKRWEISTILR